jgi:hypothetical protein
MTIEGGLPLPVTPPELESHLWEAANILRGSAVDRTDWKSYILPLLFFKRVCDVWDEEHEAMLIEYGEDFADEHCFQVPEGCHWYEVRETPTTCGSLRFPHSLKDLRAWVGPMVATCGWTFGGTAMTSIGYERSRRSWSACNPTSS